MSDSGVASVSRPGEDFRYRLTQKLDVAVRALRDAEDMARIEQPERPVADRVRSIYEQITADVLAGKMNLPPIARRLRNSQERCLRLANALDDMGMSETDCLLATVEWALNHECGGANEVTVDEYVRQIGGRTAVERAARKIESVADLNRRGVDTDFAVLGSVPQPTRTQRILDLIRKVLTS